MVFVNLIRKDQRENLFSRLLILVYRVPLKIKQPPLLINGTEQIEILKGFDRTISQLTKRFPNLFSCRRVEIFPESRSDHSIGIESRGQDEKGVFQSIIMPLFNVGNAIIEIMDLVGDRGCLSQDDVHDLNYRKNAEKGSCAVCYGSSHDKSARYLPHPYIEKEG
jgi:hypothetical protein